MKRADVCFCQLPRHRKTRKPLKPLSGDAAKPEHLFAALFLQHEALIRGSLTHQSHRPHLDRREDDQRRRRGFAGRLSLLLG